jgi:hypothetical protein
MSAYSDNQQQASVAQVIFDSLTRCFHPTDGEGGSLFSCPPRSSRSSRTTVVEFPPQTAVAPPESSRGSSNKLKTQPQPPPSPPQQQQQQRQYDADRYIHRKLEIFRTTDEECLAEFGVVPGNKAQSSSHARSNRRGHLVVSSDDEIDNLTEKQKRMSDLGNSKQTNSQVRDESFAVTVIRLLREPLSCITNVQRQYNSSLYFATPVRAASRENVTKLSDWRLTAEEFAARYGGDKGCKCDESIASQSHLEEEETITSASYFDQKYSHIIETTPPMSLFNDHRVAVSEIETDAILKIANNKREAYEANSIRTRRRSKSTTPRSSPTDNIVAVITKKPRKMTASLSKRSKKGSSPTKGGNTKKVYDLAPTGKSSSVSSTSLDGEQHRHRHRQQPQRDFREPVIVHYTLGQ